MAFCEKCGREIPNDYNVTLCDSCAAAQATVQEPVAAAAVAQATPSVPQPPQFQPNFQAMPPAPVYAAPPARPSYALPLTGDSIPPEYKPLGAWAYFLYSLLFSIPLVGFICLLVFACGGTPNINLRNFARSYFCGLLVVVILAVITVGLVFGLGMSLSFLEF